MSTKPIIGHVNCPICSHADAEVRTDKNERAYIHCKHACGWQGITRNNHQSDQLQARMRAIHAVPTVTVPEPAAPQAPAPAKPAPRPQGTAKAVPPAPAKPDAAPPKQKTSFWQPLLGGQNA